MIFPTNQLRLFFGQFYSFIHSLAESSKIDVDRLSVSYDAAIILNSNYDVIDIAYILCVVHTHTHIYKYIFI